METGWELSPVSAARATSVLNSEVNLLRFRFATGCSFQVDCDYTIILV